MTSRLRALTERQARELANMWCRSVALEYRPGRFETADALVRKELIERHADGLYRVSDAGMASLIKYLSLHARIQPERIAA